MSARDAWAYGERKFSDGRDVPAPVPFLAHEGAPALMVANQPCRDCGRPWYLGPSIDGRAIVCCARGSRIFRTSIRVARWLARQKG